jgi:hypothetical protein
MEVDRVDIYRELQAWSPPIIRIPKPCGKYTKTEAINILTTLLKNGWGSRFRTSTLRWEEELVAIGSSLDGITDESVCMKYSMIPAIVQHLGPEHYRKCLRECWYSSESVIDEDHRNIIWLLYELDIPKDSHVSLIDSSSILVGAWDIYNQPVEYKVKLPQWMKSLVDGRLLRISDVDDLYK